MSGLGLTFLRRGGQAHPTAGSDYILSESRGDPEVFRILMEKGVSSDGVGITKDDAARVTNIAAWFVGSAIEEFEEFQYFTSVSLQGVMSSTNNSFKDCTRLRAIALPLTMTSIGNGASTYSTGAFRGCTALQEVKNVDVVNNIGLFAFYGCTSLSHLSLSPNVGEIGGNAFQNTALQWDVLRLDRLTSLGGNAFNGCAINTLLIGLKLPQDATISLPNGSSSAGTQNFGKKDALKRIVFSANLKVLPISSFANYSALLRAVFLSVTPPTANNSASFGGTSCTIYVPDEAVDAYKTANNWTGFASRIVGISQLQQDDMELYNMINS